MNMRATVLLVAVESTTLVACRDSTTSVTNNRRTYSASQSVQTPAQAQKARERIHTRNKEEWVGVAHNKALDAFRQELRKPGLLTRDVCSFTLDFAVRNERSDMHARVSDGTKWQSAQSARDESRICARRERAGISPTVFRLPSEPLAAPARQSAEVETLIGEVETAVQQSTNSYDLAVQLNSVLDRAQSLSSSDQVVVGATVSVAQNSFEYWETQYDLFVREVVDEYSPCAADQSSSGVSAETVRDNCLAGGGGEGTVTLRGPNRGNRDPRMAGSRRSMSCPPSLAEGFRRVVRGDIEGAYKGALTGLFVDGLPGVVVGALSGALVGSTWAAIENAWDALRCIYHF